MILGYSMDKTVFFQTLEQYKYNPAMIIAGEAGEMIGASAERNREPTSKKLHRQE